MSETTFNIGLKLLDNYLFEIDFGEFGNLITDLPAPTGNGEGPDPEHLLAASVANCLAASLLFAIRKFKGDLGEITANVQTTLARRDGRMRIAGVRVELRLGAHADALPEIERVLGQFEEFCTVTESVRSGIPVTVTVADAGGRLLKTG